MSEVAVDAGLAISAARAGQAATGRRSRWTGSSWLSGPGEVYGYLGPNGAGKTTTIRLREYPDPGARPSGLTPLARFTRRSSEPAVVMRARRRTSRIRHSSNPGVDRWRFHVHR